MRSSVVQTHVLLAIFLAFGLMACNNPEIISKYFNGKWESSICEVGANSRSFLQKWKIFESTRFEDSILIWDQPNCPSSVTPKEISIKGAFVILHNDATNGVAVSSVCKNGKASISTLTLLSLENGAQVIKNEIIIRNELISQNLVNILPKYNLICKDSTENIHTGNLNTGNGTIPEKRPTEMDPVKSFTKQ